MDKPCKSFNGWQGLQQLSNINNLKGDSAGIAEDYDVKAGDAIPQKEMQALIQALFECVNPNITPSGIPVFLEFRKDYIDKMFEK